MVVSCRAPQQNEFVDSITADLATLGIVPAKITYTSDYFDLIIDKAEYLIKKGLAYIDTTPNEEVPAPSLFFFILFFALRQYYVNRCCCC